MNHKLSDLLTAIFGIILVGILVGMILTSTTAEYHMINRTITIIDKYEGSFIVFDQNEDQHYTTKELYIRLHPQRTYDVVIESRTDKTFYPFSSGQSFQYIKEIIGEVK